MVKGSRHIQRINFRLSLMQSQGEPGDPPGSSAAIDLRLMGMRYFLDLATERAILSSLKIVVNSTFLLIHSLFMIMESVIAPR
jgi:hypothetical protein